LLEKRKKKKRETNKQSQSLVSKKKVPCKTVLSPTLHSSVENKCYNSLSLFLFKASQTRDKTREKKKPGTRDQPKTDNESLSEEREKGISGKAPREEERGKKEI